MSSVLGGKGFHQAYAATPTTINAVNSSRFKLSSRVSFAEVANAGKYRSHTTSQKIVRILPPISRRLICTRRPRRIPQKRMRIR